MMKYKWIGFAGMLSLMFIQGCAPIANTSTDHTQTKDKQNQNKNQQESTLHRFWRQAKLKAQEIADEPDDQDDTDWLNRGRESAGERLRRKVRQGSL